MLNPSHMVEYCFGFCQYWFKIFTFRTVALRGSQKQLFFVKNAQNNGRRQQQLFCFKLEAEFLHINCEQVILNLNVQI